MIPKRHKPVADYLRGIGAMNIHMGRSGKHPRIVFEFDGRERYLSIPGSPSDSMRGFRNTIGDLRRLLGLQGAPRQAAERGAQL